MNDSVLPKNLMDIKTISKLMDLYLKTLHEHQEITEDPTKLLDLDFLTKNKTEENANVKEELFKINLDEIYKIFETVKSSEEIYNKYIEIFNTLNIDTKELKIDYSLRDKIDKEYIDASSSFKAKKGTKAGFFFVNDIINKVKIDRLHEDSYFELIEGSEHNPLQPYAYTIKASLYKEVYTETVLPLSHPVGFDWDFFRILFLVLIDYFGLKEIKVMEKLIMSCSSPDTIEKITKTNLALRNKTTGLIDYDENFGIIKRFETSTNQENNEKLIVDFYAINPYPEDNIEQDGLRLVKDYDGSVTIYQKQDGELLTVEVKKDDGSIEELEVLSYLEIDNIELVNPLVGELEIFKTNKKIATRTAAGITFEEAEIITGFRFTEYSIYDLKNLEIRYSFKDGTPLNENEILTDENRNWNIAIIPLDCKLMSNDIKYFEPHDFVRTDLLKYTTDYDGRVFDNKGFNCVINYEIKYEYKVMTIDDSEYVRNIRKSTTSERKIGTIGVWEGKEVSTDNSENTIETFEQKDALDNWARMNPDNGGAYIGEIIPLQYERNEYNEIIPVQGEVIEIGTFNISGDNPINNMDRGYNLYMDEDADINSQLNQMTLDNEAYLIVDLDDQTRDISLDPMRNEAYFSPSTLKDLDTLTKCSFKNGHSIFDVTNTPEIYERDNIGNEDYVAKEDKTVDEYILMTHNEIAIDPIYSATLHMIDANGRDRGPFSGYAIIGQSGEDVVDSYNKIDDFIIGGYIDNARGNYDNKYELCIDSNIFIGTGNINNFFIGSINNDITVNDNIYHLKTNVDADQ
jgi:hypothetical protein